MGTSGVDLGSVAFWIVVGLALVVLSTLTSRVERRMALACLNLLGLGLILGTWWATSAAAFSLLLHGGTVLQRRPEVTGMGRSYGWVGHGLMACTTLLFVFHKWPLDAAAQSLPGPWITGKSILTGLGFSYVALRAVEFLRGQEETSEVPASLIETFNFLFPFHMLAAGPIQTWKAHVESADSVQPLTFDSGLAGLDRIAQGLFKKYVLAALLKEALLTGFQVPGAYCLVEAQFFYLFVYLDFSGYSDIAVGIGFLLGVATPENFDNPLGARNIIEFWTRWHMSLSGFLRKHLFTPIQLWTARQLPRRLAAVGSLLAALVTFGFCGVWHRTNVPYLTWGLLNAAAYVLCATYRQWLYRWLGQEGFRRYMEQRAIRWFATALTFEFMAISLMIASGVNFK